MKVLLIQPIPGRLGHVIKYTGEIASNLSLLGVKTSLLTTPEFKNPPERVEIFYIPFVKNTNVKKDLSKFTSLVKYGSHWLKVNFLTILKTKLLESKFDIIHFLDIDPTVSVFLNTIINPILTYPSKRVITLHPADYSFKNYLNNPPKALYKLFSQQLLKRFLFNGFDAVMIHGEFLKQRLTTQLDIKNSLAERIFPIPYGTDFIPESNLTPKEARAKLGINFKGKIVLFFGILRRDKGLFKLFQALSPLAKKFEFKVLIAGYPREITENEINEKSREYGVRVIKILRYLKEEEIPLVYVASNVIALPYHKGFGSQSGPLTLAASYGIPAIGFDVGQMGYDIKKYKIGKVCPPDDVSCLQKLFEAFFENRWHVEKEVLKNYAKEMSWENMALKIKKMYEVLL